MRRAEIVAFAQQVQSYGFPRHLDPFKVVRKRGEVLPPKGFAAHPFCLVDFLAVKFVVPYEFPFFPGGEKTRGFVF